MYDSSDITFPVGHPQLLSEPSLLHLSSHTGPGGDDLSISELSLSDRPFQQPFSLLAPRPEPGDVTPSNERPDMIGDGEGGADLADGKEKAARLASKMREEKLQSDIFILKKLNAAFASFRKALNDTESANERIAGQLEQTDALLNKYINVLAKSEEFSRLIFNENWMGADADEDMIEHERMKAEEKKRREAEERELAARRERERLELAEKERIEQESKERAEREKKEKAATRGGVRGVRGTRASMRGSRPSHAASGSISSRPSTQSANAGKTTSKLPRSSIAPTRGI